jgi:AcrR family transcriptional regulator
MSPTGLLGRRERNKAEKRRRIAEAAAALFAAQGYARTTTQQIAAAADVADGTIFRYASTKPELLLMVMNEQVADLVEKGRVAAASAPTVHEAVAALMGPLVALVRAQPDTASPYLREVLFGEAGVHRDAALALVDGTVAQLAEILAPQVDAGRVGLSVEESARFVFSTLVNEVMRGALGRSPVGPENLTARVGVLLRGLGVV